MPGFADRGGDAKYQAYRQFRSTQNAGKDLSGMDDYSKQFEQDSELAFNTYQTYGGGADFDRFYANTSGGGQSKASLPSEAPAPAPAPAAGGGAGTPVDTSGLSAAMAGLRSAAAPAPPPDAMSVNLGGPGGSNPNLGQRTPPISMRQLAMMLPRIY